LFAPSGAILDIPGDPRKQYSFHFQAMHIHYLGDQNSILNQFILELRDTEIQKDPMRFRRNIERVGEVLCYELSKTLKYTVRTVQTPLGTTTMSVPVSPLVLCSVLRAGLPLHHGLLNYFDRAENAFISAYRHHPGGGDAFEVIVKYFAAPALDGKTLVLTDPMLATGKTLENVLAALKAHGEPSQIHILSVIGSKKGIAHIREVFPEKTHLWIAAVDDTLSAKGYIIPGLGDAGDLAFGMKL
jgi:uracil phosphoribosyltransferase